jgi:hypothetical protein
MKATIMNLKTLTAYLARRFPAEAEIIDLEISLIVDKSAGLVETISIFSADDEDNDPDDGESLAPSFGNPARGLKLVNIKG